jgi:hypothetical protein
MVDGIRNCFKKNIGVARGEYRHQVLLPTHTASWGRSRFPQNGAALVFYSATISETLCRPHWQGAGAFARTCSKAGVLGEMLSLRPPMASLSLSMATKTALVLLATSSKG